jgi:hypothetical protein
VEAELNLLYIPGLLFLMARLGTVVPTASLSHDDRRYYPLRRAWCLDKKNNMPVIVRSCIGLSVEAQTLMVIVSMG